MPLFFGGSTITQAPCLKCMILPQKIAVRCSVGKGYDNLVGLFVRTAELPGVGFGMGDVTFRNFLETHDLLPKFESHLDVFVSLPQPELKAVA